jgi:3-phenylpropionate/trans-cinnamate dioxygenase ferredoxin subunit
VTFQKAASLEEIPMNGVLAVEVDGVDVALVRDADGVYALHDECSHAAVPLSEGDVTVGAGGCEIECWLHGSMFDVRSGKALNLPAVDPVPTYPTRVDGDTVLVDL